MNNSKITETLGYMKSLVLGNNETISELSGLMDDYDVKMTEEHESHNRLAKNLTISIGNVTNILINEKPFTSLYENSKALSSIGLLKDDRAGNVLEMATKVKLLNHIISKCSYTKSLICLKIQNGLMKSNLHHDISEGGVSFVQFNCRDSDDFLFPETNNYLRVNVQLPCLQNRVDVIVDLSGDSKLRTLSNERGEVYERYSELSSWNKYLTKEIERLDFLGIPNNVKVIIDILSREELREI